mmetsp:Transcript_2413/g.6057  ORF Transcript_2413/g.6057 Transcript_2413/m.6057 type:complete len:665 (+) Transcript_2413:406-2400(+)
MGASPAMDKEQLADSLKELNMSKEEVNKFEKAFKDPKFMEMFAEYAKEISDPKNREETDLYLRQLEMENRVEEVYGKGVELIVPEAGFVIKTQDKTNQHKVFINVCHSEKVEPCKGRKTTDPSNPSRSGTSWEIPLSLGKPKNGTDKKGGVCDVYDFVVHPNTKEMAVRDARFRGLVAETAMENIEKNFGKQLDRSWKQPKMTYKGVEGAEQPHAMAVRGKDAPPSVEGRIPPRSPASSSEASRAAGQPVAVAGDVSAAGAGGSFGQEDANSRSGFSFPAPKRKVQEVKPSAPGEIGYKYASGEVCPAYQVVERGSADLAAAWGDAGRGIDVGAGVPKELVLRVELPGCTSAAGMELELEKKSISLCIPGKFKLEKRLAHRVDDSRAKAKFDKAKQRLEVTLPVVPPPAPAPPMLKVVESRPVVELPAAVEEQEAVAGDGSSDEGGEPQPPSPAAVVDPAPAADDGEEAWVAAAVEPEAAAELGEEEVQAEEEVKAAGSKQEAEEEAAGRPEEVSEMKQMWAQWTAKADEATVSTQAAVASDIPAPQEVNQSTGKSRAKPETAGNGGFLAAEAFQGAKPGMVFQRGVQGLGYYPDSVAPATPAASAAAAKDSKSRAAAALAGAGLLGTHTAAAALPTSVVTPAAAASAPRLKPRINQALAEELD